MLEPSFNDFLSALRFILPAYVANSSPVIFGGGKAMDLGKSFLDGRRIFGSNKTVRGFIGGLSCGALISLIEDLLTGGGFFPYGVLIAAGALLGDLLGAFIKRRLGLPPGFPFPLMDQLDFVFGALALSRPFYRLSLSAMLLVFLATPPLHLLTNGAAYILKLKKYWW